MPAMPVAPSVPMLTLVVGPEEFLASLAIADVVSSVRAVDPEAAVSDVAVANLQSGDLEALLNPSLFGERRLLVLRGFEDADKSVAGALEVYLADPLAEVSIVAVHAGGAKGRKLLESIAAKATKRIECAGPRNPGERRDFVAAEVARAGGRIDPAAADALLLAVGNDLRSLATACGQLVSDVGGVIDEATIARYHRGRPETTGFAVADRVMAGDAAGALELFRWGQSVNVAPVLFTSGLAAALRSVVQVAPYLRERPFELARRLGLPSWRVEKAQRQARGWHPEAIADAVLAVARADGEVKGGAADPAYAVERMLLAVSAARAGR
jgi:DNA polymerase-3 subunit delta